MAIRGARRKTLHMDGHAVTDVVGAVLMVGMTVGMTVVLSLLLVTYKGPSPSPHSAVAVTVLPGANGWGSGDETVRIRHLGGDPLTRSTHVIVRIGSTTTDLTGAALGAPFTDGRFTTGETWSRAWTIQATDLVHVDVVGAGGQGGTLLATTSIVPGTGAPA